MKPSWKAEYFQISSFFICLVLFVPIILLFAASVGLVLYLSRAEKSQPDLRIRKSSKCDMRKMSSTQNISVFRPASYQITSHVSASQQQQQQYRRKQLVLKTAMPKEKTSLFTNQQAHRQLPHRSKPPQLKRPTRPKFSFKLNSKFFNKNILQTTTGQMNKNSKKLSIMTILISLSFSLLNMPYLVVWAFFYRELAYNNNLDMPTKYSFFSAVQIAEIFFLLYYSLNVYIYFIFKSLFIT